MELSLSHSSFRATSKYITPRRCNEPTTKVINSCKFSNSKFAKNGKYLSLQARHDQSSKFSKSSLMLYGRHKSDFLSVKSTDYSDSVLAKSHAESADSDSVLANAQNESSDSDLVFDKVLRFGSACYKFLKPYATYQAVISAMCLFARVFVENPQLFNWSLLFKAIPGVIAVVLSQVYYLGINQIYDIDIDRVNKPHLALPSGELSLKQAWFLVILSLLAGLLIFPLTNADLVTTSLYCLGTLVGTTYSVPPLRFKRNPITASIVISLANGFIHTLCVLYATRTSLGLPFQWSPPTVFIIASATLYYFVLSVSKDLTDVEGDMKHNIRTFAAIFGPKVITFFCTGMLLVNYVGGIAASIFMPQAFKSYIMLPAHAIFALWLLFQAKKLDKANYTKEASADFFQVIWNLTNYEFLLFPFI